MANRETLKPGNREGTRGPILFRGKLLHGIQDEMRDGTGGHPFDSAQGPDH